MYLKTQENQKIFNFNEVKNLASLKAYIFFKTFCAFAFKKIVLKKNGIEIERFIKIL